jgi:hypothetical protein
MNLTAGASTIRPSAGLTAREEIPHALPAAERRSAALMCTP